MLLERKLKKIQKKRPSIPCFWKDTCWRRSPIEKKFCKKVQKNPPMRRFLERYLFGSECDFSWIVKNPEKSQKFSGQFHFFLEDTCLGQSGQNTGFRKEKSKKVRKNQTTSGFSSKILVWSDPMATLTTTLNEQKGTQS